MKKSELKELIREVIKEANVSSPLKEETNKDVADLIVRARGNIDSTFKDSTINIAAKKTLLMIMHELIKGNWHPASAPVAENKK